MARPEAGTEREWFSARRLDSSSRQAPGFRRLLIRNVAVLAAVALLSGCSSQRRVAAPVPTASSPVAGAHPDASTGDEAPEQDPEIQRKLAESRVKERIQSSRELYLEGESLFNQGQRDGGGNFERALDRLRDPAASPVLNRQLEQAYYSLLGRIEDLRLDDLDSVQDEDSSIEWLANRNVFTIRVDPKLKHLASEDLLTSQFDVPVVLNERVLRFLTYYRTRGRTFMERGLRRSGRYLEMFKAVFRQEGIPLDLIYLAHIESLFRPEALSRARAKGIWQFIRGTGRMYGLRQDWWIDERSDILKSTVAAARFLKHLHGEFGDWYLAMAGYNCGPRRIERILRRYGRIDYWEMVRRRLLPRETRNYVPSYLAATIIFKNPARYGFHVERDPELRFETVPMEHQVDLDTLAELMEVPAQTSGRPQSGVEETGDPSQAPRLSDEGAGRHGSDGSGKGGPASARETDPASPPPGQKGRDAVADRPPLLHVDSGHRSGQSAPQHPSAPDRTGAGHSAVPFREDRRGSARGVRRSAVPIRRGRTSSAAETRSTPSPAPMA